MHSTNLLLEEPIRMASILEPSKTVTQRMPFAALGPSGGGSRTLALADPSVPDSFLFFFS